MNTLQNRSLFALFSLFIAVGCRPAEAPEDYEELVAFLFEHTDDEEEAHLVAGLNNLASWLSDANLEMAEAGVTIDSLPESAVSPLAGHDHTVEGLSGVSLVSSSDYQSDVLMDALTQYSFKTMMPDVFLTYDRDFETGRDCIVSRECLWAEGEVYSIADWGILGEVEAKRRIEFRWVETDEGWAFLQRWWLLEPSTGSSLNLLIGDQYYIGVNLPMAEGTRRVHSSWLKMQMSTGDTSDGAANQLIDNWKTDSERLDTWITDNL